MSTTHAFETVQHFTSWTANRFSPPQSEPVPLVQNSAAMISMAHHHRSPIRRITMPSHRANNGDLQRRSWHETVHTVGCHCASRPWIYLHTFLPTGLLHSHHLFGLRFVHHQSIEFVFRNARVLSRTTNSNKINHHLVINNTILV